MKILILLSLFTLALTATVVESDVFASIKKNGNANIMIEMGEQVDFSRMTTTLESLDWKSRGRLVYKMLTEMATETQKETKALLDAENIKYENLWIQNTISAKAVPRSILLKLSTVKSIGRVWLDAEDKPTWETPEKHQPLSNPKRPEAGLTWIKATDAWAAGYTGEGVVLATADSGTLWTHPALRPNYRGNEDGTINHNYNWYDPPAKSRTPVDAHGHGTHCQGTVTGGVARKIGVAPDAKWISCRIASRGFIPSNILACWQFFLAPHDLNGRNAKPDLRPHAASHSYGCGTCRLAGAIAGHRAAGIAIVGAAGNSGPRCNSHGYPSREKDVLSIGALASRSNSIARFSSRGPGVNGISKPHFALPGSSVTSSSRTGGYTAMSGTSMAAPHMNGAIGLLWSAVPELMGRHDETYKVFEQTALKQRSNDCGSSGSPNNVFGYGSIDVLAAIQHGKSIYGAKAK